MQPIFDSEGATVAWLNGDVIHELDGRAAAFVRNRAVYNYAGGQRGWFDSGFLRDRDGDAVAFMDGCRGGPLPPLHEVPPIPPITAIPPIPPIPAISVTHAQLVGAKLGTISWNRINLIMLGCSPHHFFQAGEHRSSNFPAELFVNSP